MKVEMFKIIYFLKSVRKEVMDQYINDVAFDELKPGY